MYYEYYGNNKENNQFSITNSELNKINSSLPKTTKLYLVIFMEKVMIFQLLIFQIYHYHQ